jgi:putative membrane protein
MAVALEVPLGFALAAWLAHRAPALLHALTPASRARWQVERAAAAHFVAEAVHGTKRRTGLLIYLSLLERQVAVLADIGIESRIPSAIRSEVVWSATRDPSTLRTGEDFVRGLSQIGAILRTRMPGEDTEGNETPDAPRFVS